MNYLLLDLTARDEYAERLRKTAQANYAAKIDRLNRRGPSAISRLHASLVHLSHHLTRRPHSLKDVMVPR